MTPTVTVTLVEGAEAGDGGFVETIWSAWVNDYWMKLGRLLYRRSGLGGVTATVEGEDDPNDLVRGRQHKLRPRAYWKRVVVVEAPIGTRFLQQRWVPNRERARENPLLPRVPYDKYAAEFRLMAAGHLVSVRAIEARERARRARESLEEKPMSAKELSERAERFLRSFT